MRRFERELDELRRSLIEMAELVETAISRSVLALLRGDEAIAEQVFQNEKHINRMQIDIDDKATRLLALEQPVAKDLRFITAAQKINNDLERMADEAVNIAEHARGIAKEPPLDVDIDIPRLAELTEEMVRKALESFMNAQPEVARSVLGSDDAVDDMRDIIYGELLAVMEKNPAAIRRCVHLLFVAHSLERIADHATNIAEDVLFLVQGIDVRHHAESGA